MQRITFRPAAEPPLFYNLVVLLELDVLARDVSAEERELATLDALHLDAALRIRFDSPWIHQGFIDVTWLGGESVGELQRGCASFLGFWRVFLRRGRCGTCFGDLEKVSKE